MKLWTGMLLAAALLGGCGSDAQGTCGADFEAQEGDFTCAMSWPEAGGVRVRAMCGGQDRAEALLNNPAPGQVFPVGTMLMLMPGEAMVKRGPGFDSANGDWEYFVLGGNAAGTRIKERGAGISNGAGSCRECHAGGRSFDFVCQSSNGCEKLALPHGAIRALQYVDARCLPP